MTSTTGGCRVCGSIENSVIRHRLRNAVRRSVLRCNRCGLIYLAQGFGTATYTGKKYRARYGPNLNRQSTPESIFETYLPYQQFISDRIAHLLHPTTKILDVGCSTGHFLHSLQGRVKTRVGLELNREAVQFIRKRLDFPVYSEPVEKFDIPEGPFDVITALQVLEHTESPVDFLKALCGHLKPGGHLYLEVPNIDDVVLSTYGVEAYGDFYYREAHVSYFSSRTLKKAVSKAGWTGTIESVQRYSFRNHLTWLLTGAPQSDFTLGNQPAWLVDGQGLGSIASRKLNAFMRKTDEEYKRLVGDLGLGESLTFLGRAVRRMRRSE